MICMIGRSSLRRCIGSSIDAKVTGETSQTRISSLPEQLMLKVALRAIEQKRFNPQFWDAIADRARVLLPGMKPRSMALIAYCFSRSRQTNKEFFSELCEAVCTNIKDFSARDLSFCVNSLTRSGFRSSRRWRNRRQRPLQSQVVFGCQS